MSNLYAFAGNSMDLCSNASLMHLSENIVTIILDNRLHSNTRLFNYNYEQCSGFGWSLLILTKTLVFLGFMHLFI